MSIHRQIAQSKSYSAVIANLDSEKRNAVLTGLHDALIKASEAIIVANQKDLARMDSSDPKYDRLLLDKSRIAQIAKETQKVASLSDPLAQILSNKTLDNGLIVQKISVPLGVIGIIYESRPNVTVDVFSLCFKAGNICILKGGKEAENTNQILVDIIQNVLAAHQLPTETVLLLPHEREVVDELLNAIGLIDVCIPRGSQQLIDYVRKHAKVPVIETGAGIVHTYFDKAGDLNMGKEIILNAKTRRVSVCNALDTLIIHQARIPDLPELVSPLADKKVELYADKASYQCLSALYPASLLQQATREDFGKEFLSLKMAIKTVSSLEEALKHIAQFSSKHSEAIISDDKTSCDMFIKQVDAAAVYANTSTAFTDGGEFGLGAEIGISTQKLHARGPMGLEALTSYKLIIYGKGQIR